MSAHADGRTLAHTLDALQKIKTLHYPVTEMRTQFCVECTTSWPCATFGILAPFVGDSE